MNPVISQDLLNNFEAIARIGALGTDAGYLRAGYSAEESRAIAYVENEAKKLGLTCRYDAIGNFVAETPETVSSYVEVASHLDTVPAGGNYDGVAGVLCGLEAIASVLRTGASRSKGLRLRIWRLEESATFGGLYVGSAGAFGQADPKFLSYLFKGQTLESAMLSQGFDPEYIRNRKPTISQTEIDSIDSHIELHIEQGVFLERTTTDIGIVTGIRGPRRYLITLKGQFDHSGATPMGVEFRKDTNLALGYMIVELDRLLNRETAHGKDLVQTIGVINSDEVLNSKQPQVYLNAMTKVSGFCYFSLDIRSIDSQTAEGYSEEALSLIRTTAEKFGVTVEIDQKAAGAGLPDLDERVQTAIEDACRDCSASFQYMPSGAGHDAGIVAKQKKSNGEKVPVGMIFIPCRDGISHDPLEYASAEALVKGAQVMAGALIELAK